MMVDPFYEPLRSLMRPLNGVLQLKFITSRQISHDPIKSSLVFVHPRTLKSTFNFAKPFTFNQNVDDEIKKKLSTIPIHFHSPQKLLYKIKYLLTSHLVI